MTDRRAVIEAARDRGGSGSVLGPYRFDARGRYSRRPLALYGLEAGRLEYRGRPPLDRLTAAARAPSGARVRARRHGAAMWALNGSMARYLLDDGVGPFGSPSCARSGRG